MRILLSVAALLSAVTLHGAVTVKNGANQFHWEDQDDIHLDAEGYLLVGDDRIKLKPADSEFTCDGDVFIEDMCFFNTPLFSLDVIAAHVDFDSCDENITIPSPGTEITVIGEILTAASIPRTYHVEGDFYWNDYYYGFLYLPSGTEWYYSFSHGWFYPTEFSPAGHYSFFLDSGWQFIPNPPPPNFTPPPPPSHIPAT